MPQSAGSVVNNDLNVLLPINFNLLLERLLHYLNQLEKASTAFLNFYHVVPFGFTIGNLSLRREMCEQLLYGAGSLKMNATGAGEPCSKPPFLVCTPSFGTFLNNLLH